MLDLLILVGATWRLTSLLVWEEGPFEVFARLRHLLGVRYDDQSQPYGANWLAKGVICPACTSVWFGTLWVILYYLWGDSVWIAMPFALSAGAIVLERWNNG